MPVQAIALTFLMQQDKKDQLSFLCCAGNHLTAIAWCEGEHRYKTSIAMAEGAYLCLRPLIFCCISGSPLGMNHSSPTAQFLSCGYHQVCDFSEIRALNLPHSPSPSTQAFSMLCFEIAFVAQSKLRIWMFHKEQGPASFTASCLSTLKWGCLNLLFFPAAKTDPCMI